MSTSPHDEPGATDKPASTPGSRPSEATSEAAASLKTNAKTEDPFTYTAELKRKALHLLALVVPFGMDWLGSPAALYVLAPVAAMAVTADILRAYWTPFSTLIRRIFGPLMRAGELPAVGDGIVINGATCVLIGATMLAAFFPLDIAVPVFIMTMIADAAAALVGRRLGRHPWPGSSHTVEGSAAFVVTGLAVFAFFPDISVLAAALGVGTGAVVEAAPLPLNDNIRVPLASALVILLVA